VKLDFIMAPVFEINSPSEDLARTTREEVWPVLERMLQKNLDGAAEKMVRAIDQTREATTSRKA